MAMMTVDVPPEALSALRLAPAEFGREMRVAAAIYWYQRAELSQAAAARVAGMTRLEFLDLLAARQVDVFAVDVAELEQELARG